ncbi:MAG: phospholipase [Solibacillus sp.]
MNYFSIDGVLNEWMVLFHGTGGNEFSLLQIAGDIEANANVLSFIGEVGSGAQRRFFAPLENGALPRADFDARVENFLAAWEEVKPKNADKITFLGYSNGANFVLGILEKAPEIADRIVLMHPSNLDYTFEAGSDVQLIITAGSMDTLAIPGDTMKLAKQLEQTFPNTTMKLLDGGHGVLDAEIEYLQKLLK